MLSGGGGMMCVSWELIVEVVGELKEGWRRCRVGLLHPILSFSIQVFLFSLNFLSPL
jgi:hypothetical protein